LKLNFDYINEICGNDKEYKIHLIGILFSELQKELKVFLEVSIKPDYVKTHEIIHKTKHKINMFKLEDFYQFIIEFDLNIKTGKMNSDDKNKYLENLNELISNLSKELK